VLALKQCQHSIQRAQQKSKEREHEKENATLNGLEAARREQYLCLEISVFFFVEFSAK
jgi:hypothetical protein